MTLMEFFGCSFLAFGPPLAMFSLTIAQDPVRIIILVASASLWLLSLLISSLLWFAVVPLRNELAFGLVFSVLFQEIFRYLIHKLLHKAEEGLKRVSDVSVLITGNKHVLSYVAGLGFGIMSGAFSLVNVLADGVGPGTVGLKSGSDRFFITSAATTFCFVLLHIFWTVIFFNAIDTKNIKHLLWVIGSHMFVSCITLLNQKELYLASMIPLYVVMVITAGFAYKVVGGTSKSFLAFLGK